MGEPDLPCPYHGADAVCDRCPQRYGSDGQGFPHPRAVPAGVRRLRHCPSCGEIVSPEQWDARPTGRKPFPKLAPWQCLQCSTEDAEASAAETPEAPAGAGRAMPPRRT